MVGSDGEVVRLVGTLTDVTDFKTAEERLLHDAVHDNLTGLPNRELFLDRLDTALGFAKANSGIRPTVMVIDLDHFQQVNELVGVAVGDSICSRSPADCRACSSHRTRWRDWMAKLSARFSRVLEKDTGPLIAFAETMRKAIGGPITFGDHEIALTASIGLALSDGEPQQGEELLKDAELAMYHGKRIGGDCIEVFKPAMRARKSDRAMLQSELRRALEREEIIILYQPIVRLEDRAVAGFAALPRRHVSQKWGGCRRSRSPRSTRTTASWRIWACSFSNARRASSPSGNAPA